MEVWLDGKYWGPWILKVYLPEIENVRETFIDRILPALPDAEHEAEVYGNSIWEGSMPSPFGEDYDPGSLAEWVNEKQFERYERLLGARQAVMNMGIVMLWSLIEQQLLGFHRHQVLTIEEEQEALRDPIAFKKLCNLGELKSRLNKCGYSFSGILSWPKIDELRLAANTIKHGTGDSAGELLRIRPDLFSPPEIKGVDGVIESVLNLVETKV